MRLRPANESYGPRAPALSVVIVSTCYYYDRERPKRSVIPKTSRLEAETALYRRELPRLLKEGKSGKFIVIGEGRIVGTYGTYEEALTAGYTKLGDRNFLVKQIEVAEKVHFFTRDIDNLCAG